MKVLKFLRASVVLLFIINKINSEVFYGHEKYTEFYTGNMNILISAPHDGQLKPSTITDRTSDVSGNLLGDYNTRKLGLLIKSELMNLFKNETNNEPFIMFNNLHRVKMDPNRDENECCANKNEASFIAYNDYHNFIVEKFEKGFMESNKNYKQALLIDVHGQSHAENWIELGYLLTANQLNTIKNLTDYQSSSINSLAAVSNYRFEDLIRGSVSLGGIMESKFKLKVVPSPSYLSPNGGNYYNGGFITKVYSSNTRAVRINTIQIETPYSMRVNTAVDDYASCFARSIYEFYMIHKLNK